MATKKDVAKKEENLPVGIDFSKDVGAGFEEADSSSYAIPFLRILQAMSGQCKKKDPEYVEGAEEGDFFNTVTEQVYKDGVIVIPCHYKHTFNEWALNRGGFRGSHSAAEYQGLERTQGTDSKGNTVELNAQTGNQLVDTREHYCIIVNEDGTYEPVLLALSSTQLKKSKKWMTFMQTQKVQGHPAPMFSQMYKLSTVQESNDQGDWAGLKVEHVGEVTSPELYQAAKNFRELVKTGAAKAAMTEDDTPF